MKRNLKTLAAVLGPAIALSFLFSVNLKAEAASRVPAVHKTEKQMSFIQAMKKGIELSVAK